MTDVQLISTNNIIKIKKQIVKPGEMIETKLDAEKLKVIKELKEFRLDVRKH